MNSQSLTLDEFIAAYPLWDEWEVSYTDGTHLPRDEYVKLGKIMIDASEGTAQHYPILPFTFQFVTDQQIKDRFSELPEGKQQAGRARKIIRDSACR